MLKKKAIKMDEKELIKKFRHIRFLLEDASSLHDRSSLHNAIDLFDKLLKEYSIEVPDPMPRDWWKSE
jgi:hypothetical protein